MELRDDLIVLRPWREDDADAVHAACQDAEIHRWIPVIPRPYTHEDARTFVTGKHGLGGHQFAIESEGHVVGSVGMNAGESKTSRTGYWCAQGARGRGITTRALRVLCRYGLAELGLQRLELITDPENHASQRVATKVGFQREGVFALTPAPPRRTPTRQRHVLAAAGRAPLEQLRGCRHGRAGDGLEADHALPQTNASSPRRGPLAGRVGFRTMSIGASLFLIAVGAILRYAVTESISGINLQTVGLILMIVGIIGLVVSVVWMIASSRGHPVARDPRDPRGPY